MNAKLQNIARLEMEAFDSLPREVQRVFNDCPRKVSVLGVMNLPGVRRNLEELGPVVFAEKLKDILAKQAEGEAVIST